jgi:phenylalanyl-tRNA synthetase beta chain
VHNLLACFGITDIIVRPDGPEYYHPWRRSNAYIGKTLIYDMGEIHENVAHSFQIDSRIYISNIYIEELLTHARSISTAPILSRYPAIIRDIALVMDEAVYVGDVIGAIRQAGGEYLTNVELFDIYRGEQIKKFKKSVAFTLVFMSKSRTLTDTEAENSIKNILDACNKHHGAVIRA